MKKAVGDVTITRTLDNEKVLQFYVDHAKEISIRAIAGNVAAQRVQRRGERLTKCRCINCVNSFARAVFLYCLSTLN